MYARKVLTIVLVILLMVFLSSCGNGVEKGEATNGPEQRSGQDVGSKDGEDIQNKEKLEEDETSNSQAPVPAEEEIPEGPLPPNEAGQVMVLMYHGFSDKESTWVRTWENFRRDLERLYEVGYRLVSMKDYLNNTIDLPAGYSPVILTFDDAYASQFDIEKQDSGSWSLKPQTAVGIMYDFYQEYPDFGLEGIFYINSYPFNSRHWREAVAFLVNELGMDVGNHTRTHINMSKHTSAKIQEEVGGLVLDIKEVLPDYEMDSLALPFGVSPPKGVSLSGEYKGIKYENRGVLLVGANPALAPIAKGYNPLRIPRIRGDEENITKWLNYFEENPHLRYVSDGNPERITIPEDMADRVRPEVLEDERIYLYNRTGEVGLD
ncbi:MAG: polysaccharide deacetylase family protein [Bacillota bacterium]